MADRAVVAGGNYAAVALGTVTLLQSLVADDGKISLPRVSIDDEPAAAYRGLMIDVARQYHSIAEPQATSSSSAGSTRSATCNCT